MAVNHQAGSPFEAEWSRSVPRRRFLGGMGGLVAALAVPGCVSRVAREMAEGGVDGAHYAYVGCYSTLDRDGNGDGINVYRMDPVSGGWSHVQLVAGLENPSFLALDGSQRFLYSVHGDRTYATAFVIDPESGRLTRLNQQEVGGENPVHLAVDQTDRFLVVSNYSSGSLAVLPINTDGSLSPRSDLVELEGTPGPHPIRQTSSNPHHNPFDPGGRFLVVPDLGLDRLFVFQLNTATGALVPADPPFVATRAGAGPRHVDFHPTRPYAYVINELDSTVAAYRYNEDRGGLSPLQVSSTLPSGFTGLNTCAEIRMHPGGTFLYGSNRGHNSIVIFSVDQRSGLVTPVGWEFTRGERPRYFGLNPTGTLLYACNEGSDTVVTFRIDQETGELMSTGQIVETGSPVTIVFKEGGI